MGEDHRPWVNNRMSTSDSDTCRSTSTHTAPRAAAPAKQPIVLSEPTRGASVSVNRLAAVVSGCAVRQ